MRPAVKAALLWGVISGLLFGVLSQGYQFASGGGIGFPATLLVMLGVATVTATLSYVFDGRL